MVVEIDVGDHVPMIRPLFSAARLGVASLLVVVVGCSGSATEVSDVAVEEPGTTAKPAEPEEPALTPPMAVE